MPQNKILEKTIGNTVKLTPFFRYYRQIDFMNNVTMTSLGLMPQVITFFRASRRVEVSLNICLSQFS